LSDESGQTNLPEGARLAHRIIEKVTGHLMCPVATDHIVNYDFTSHYYCKLNGVTNYRDLKDEWVRVDSTSAVESGSRKIKSIFFDGEEESCGDVMIKWLDCTSESGDLLPIVILIRLGAEEMPDATLPMILMEIPGLNISSSKDIRATETVGWVVFLKSGSSMIDFHSWYEKKILHEHWKLIHEQRLKLTAHNTISDDECMQIWLDSDITNLKFVTDTVNMAESHNN
jgi:hypothetical protein